jgi:hypothetical protein
VPDPLTVPLHDTAIVATAVSGTRGDPGGINWRLPLLARMVILHLVPPPALSPS